MSGTKRPWLDAESGDFVFENGAPKHDASAMTHVVFALRMRRGSCPLMPKLGSRLHEIRTARANSAARAESYVREALKHLTDRGEVRGLVVQSTANRGRLDLVIAYRDRASVQRTVRYTIGA